MTYLHSEKKTLKQNRGTVIGTKITLPCSRTGRKYNERI